MTRRRETTSHREEEGGFTLVELLVSLALLALVAVLLASAIQSGRKILGIAEGTQREQPTEALRLILKDLISGARPGLSTNALPQQERPTFDGGSDRLDFLTLLEKRGQYAGHYEASILTEQSATRRDTLDLIVLFRPQIVKLSESKPAGRGADRHILHADVSEFQLTYFGQRELDKVAAWHAVWRERGRLPQLIGIRFRKRSGQSRSGFEQIISVPFSRAQE